MRFLPFHQGLVACALALFSPFLCHALTVEDYPKLPQPPGPCPRELEPFFRYIIQHRAAIGLNSLLMKEEEIPKNPPPVKRGHSLREYAVGTVYGGWAEDANIAWVAAAAYQYPWSKYYHDANLRKRAFLLVDTLVTLHANKSWDDMGLQSYFGPQSFSWAVLTWLETGDVDEKRAKVWRDAVAKSCDEGLAALYRFGPGNSGAFVGQYANPEMYFLSGLAAGWKVTGQKRYLEEGSRILRRYSDAIYEGGGVAYFLQSSPQHGYQEMVTKSLALYWSVTGDEYALGLLRRMAPYFPNVQHRSGLLTNAENPHLKHAIGPYLNPAAPAMIASILGDKSNRWAADVAVQIAADVIDKKKPSFGEDQYHFNWYNYQMTTYAVVALRLMAKQPLPSPTPLPERRVSLDKSFRGIRSQWDDFTVASTTRPQSDSLAGAYLADPKEAAVPLHAGVDGIYFEILQGRKSSRIDEQDSIWKREYRAIEWSPSYVGNLAVEGVAASSCISRLCAPYWSDMPWMTGEKSKNINEVSNWVMVQHWLVWRNYLVGFGSLRSYEDGGVSVERDVAQVRWNLTPYGRTRTVVEESKDTFRIQYGNLQVDLRCLEEKGGFVFKKQTPEERFGAKGADQEWSPALSRTSPWSMGDFANVATVIHPVKSEGSVYTQSLKYGGAAILLEPGGKKAYVWVANLWRHYQHYLLEIPAGVKVRTFKRDVELPDVPPGEPASLGLMGGEGGVWILESVAPMNPLELLKALKSGEGR